jgi:uncharacterized protein YndB with AHSA1/START domain
MKVLLTIVAALASLLAVVWCLGLLVPERHVVVRSARYAASPKRVWTMLSDFQDYPRWAPEVTGVQRLADQAGHPVYQFEGKWGMPLEIESLEPPRRIVTRIADPKLPFAGTWTWVVTPESGGTRVTVTEHGEIKPPPMRAMARFVFGYDSSMDQYLTALGRGLGVGAMPEAARVGR